MQHLQAQTNVPFIVQLSLIIATNNDIFFLVLLILCIPYGLHLLSINAFRIPYVWPVFASLFKDDLRWSLYIVKWILLKQAGDELCQNQVRNEWWLSSAKPELWVPVTLVRVECVRCPWALLRNEVSTIFGIIFLLFFLFWATYFSPRRGCPRVMEFCTEF